MAYGWPVALLLLLGAVKAASGRKISNDLVTRFVDADVVGQCGRSAFGMSGKDVCKDVDIEAMIPIALLWLNCEHEVAGVVTFPCRSFRWIPVARKPASCLSTLSSHEFLRVMNFAMRAFDVCSKVARQQRTSDIRVHMGELVSTARESITSQREVRELVERLVQSSITMLAVQENTWTVLVSLQMDSEDALKAARSLAQDISEAKKASARVQSEVESLGSSLLAGTKQTAEVAQAMNDELENVIEEFGKVQPSLRRTLQKTLLLLCLSIGELVSIMFLSYRGVLPTFVFGLILQVIGLIETWVRESTPLLCLFICLLGILPLSSAFVLYSGICVGHNGSIGGHWGKSPVEDELDTRSQHESRASSSQSDLSDAISSNRLNTHDVVS